MDAPTSTLVWIEFPNLRVVARSKVGLYSISPGGRDRKSYVLRFMQIHPTLTPPVALGIHTHLVDAQDEANRHHLNPKGA